MARAKTPIASYTIAWSLITIPVKSYVAADDEDVPLQNVHAACAERGAFDGLGRREFCKTCDATVRGTDVVKAFTAPDGQRVTLTEAEFKAVAGEASRTMTVVGWMPLADIDPVHLGATHYLGPIDDTSGASFVLMREAMRDSGMVAIVTYCATRGTARDKLGMIRPSGGALMLHELYYASEIRSFVEQAKVPVREITLNPSHRELAKKLIEQDAMPNLASFADQFLVRLREFLDRRLAEGGTVSLEAPAPVSAPVIDLMAALQASLASRKAPAAAPAREAAPEPVSEIQTRARRKRA